MKTLSFSLLLALVMLAGCSADGLTGPDTFTADAPLSVDAPGDDAARAPAPAFPITGAWRASDRLGTITLFLDASAVPVFGKADTKADIGGKGLVTNRFQREPIVVLVEGKHQRLNLELALLGESGEPLAKGRGRFSADFTEFKLVLLYDDGWERTLEFSRI